MNTKILGIIVMFAVSVALAIPFGKYIAKVYGGEKTLPDPLFNPIEKFFYKISGIVPTREMNWKEHMTALLTINLVWFLLGMGILMTQQWLPLNPDNNPNMSAD